MTVETSTGVVPHDHVVHFYAHDDDLTTSVAQFVVTGLHEGEAVIVVATPAHVAAFTEAIGASGIDVVESVADGALLFLDAAQALSTFMADRLDAATFSTEIGEVVERALDRGRRVRIYGEMVDLLWESGDVAAAIELEQLWNDLRRRLPFSLFCAYRVVSSEGDDRNDSFRRVCDLHSAVLMPEPVLTAAEWRRRGGLAVARSEDARSFACELRSPGAARRFVIDTLTAWGHGDFCEDAAIIVAELATNAVAHARSELVVAVSAHDDAVRLSVRDASKVLPVVRVADPLSTSGRGMLLVAAISQRWGTELVTDGKVVWAEIAKQ